jgi:small-conductance mechanosensitive channel
MIKLFKKIKDIILFSNFKITVERKKGFYFRLVLTLFLGYLVFYFERGLSDFIYRVVEILFYYNVISFGIHFLRLVLTSVYRTRNRFSEDYRDNFITGINNITTIVTIFIFLVYLLFSSGIDLIRFFTTLGLFSVAFAWVFKEKLSNLIDGISLLFSENIRLKDYVRISDKYNGVIKSISFTTTEVLTDNGDLLYVPNDIIANSEVLNYSKGNIKKISLEFSLSSKDYHKIDKLEKLMFKKLISKFNRLIDSDSFKLKITKIENTHANLLLEVEVTKFTYKLNDAIRKFISREILKFAQKK